MDILNINQNIKNGIENIMKIGNNPNAQFALGLLKNCFNAATDFGLRMFLPNLIEDQIIEVKDALIEGGLKKAGETAVNKVNEFKDTIVNLVKGNITNTKEIRLATKNGGILKTFSKILSEGIDYAVKGKKISKDNAKIIKAGKTAIFNQFSKNLESGILKEISNIQKLNDLNMKWENAYDNRNFDEMKKIISKIKTQLEKVSLMAEIYKKATLNIDLHNYVEKNNTFDYMVGADGALIKCM